MPGAGPRAGERNRRAVADRRAGPESVGRPGPLKRQLTKRYDARCHEDIRPEPAQSRLTVTGRPCPGPARGLRLWRRFESHFKSSFGDVNTFNSKKLKLSLSPSPQWPQAALRLGPGGDGRRRQPSSAGKFLRQPETKGSSVFGLESFDSIPETYRSSVETCTWAI